MSPVQQPYINKPEGELNELTKELNKKVNKKVVETLFQGLPV